MDTADDRPSHHRGWHFPVDRRHVLMDKERRLSMPPEPLLEAAGIGPGETVVDVGAGTGFWSLPLSRLVGPAGKVIAVDIEPVMLDEVRALVEKEDLRNVEVVQSEELSVPLPDAIADAGVLGFVLHEPGDTAIFLREVARLLKLQSRIIVVDWHKRPTEKGPPVQHRLSQDESRALLEAEGFRVEAVPVPGPDVYALLGIRG